MHVMHLMYSHIDRCSVYNNGNVIFKSFEVTMWYDSEEMTIELILFSESNIYRLQEFYLKSFKS